MIARVWPLLLAAGAAFGQDAFRPEEFAEYRPAQVRYRPIERPEPLPVDPAGITGLDAAGLSDDARSILASGGFVVVRRGRPGFLEALIEARRLGVPPCYTEDLFLHVHARAMARVLRTLEDEALGPSVERLGADLAAAIESAPAGDRGDGHDLARAWIHVLVALGGDLRPVPADLRGVVARELACVLAADGLRTSPLLGRDVDYSAFRPSAAYASGRRRCWFQRLVWAGSVGFRMNGIEGAAARHLARALDRAGARERRRDLVAAIQFFSGAAADLDLEELDSPAPPDPDRLPIGEPGAEPEVHLLPRRSLPDAFILQELAHPRVGDAVRPRLFPSGLDVWSVFGSPRARAALRSGGAEDFAGYPEAKLALAERFAPLYPFEARRWGRTLYWGRLHAARPLLDLDLEAPCAFERTEAWADRRLQACLGSWVDAQAGEPGTESRTGTGPMPAGGVLLPPPVFFARLEALAAMAREGILSRAALREGLGRPGRAGDPLLLLDRLERLLGRCREVGTASREGRPLDAAARAFLDGLAADLGALPVHGGTIGESEVAFSLHVRGRGTYHLVESTGPVDDLYVVGPGGALRMGPAYRWGEAVYQDPPPSGPVDTEIPAFVRPWTTDR